MIKDSRYISTILAYDAIKHIEILNSDEHEKWIFGEKSKIILNRFAQNLKGDFLSLGPSVVELFFYSRYRYNTDTI